MSIPERWWYTAAAPGKSLPAHLDLNGVSDAWLKGDYGLYRADVTVPQHAPIYKEIQVYKDFNLTNDFTRTAAKVKVCGGAWGWSTHVATVLLAPDRPPL